MQELAVVVAPKLMGGAAACTPLGELGFTAMDQVMSLQQIRHSSLADDWLLQALLPTDR